MSGNGAWAPGELQRAYLRLVERQARTQIARDAARDEVAAVTAERDALREQLARADADLAAHDAQVRAEALAPIEALAEEWEGTAETPAESEWDEGFRDGHGECAAQLRAAMEAKG